MRAVVSLWVAVVLAIPLSASGTEQLPAPEEWSSIAESGGCGLPRFYPPRTGASGGLGSNTYVRGPFGALFGRTIGQVEANLVSWTVPMSGGVSVRVHKRLLPALRIVEANLAAEASLNRSYRARSGDTHGWTPRTSVAHDGISFHAMGAAIDVNAGTNPYRLDNVLITDMPDWWIAAWEGAGMCWGGHWNTVKDAMHFSWTGPGGVPGQRLPMPYAPLTAARVPTTVVASRGVVFDGPVSHRFVADLSGDGAPDVVQLRPWHDGNAVLEMANARREFKECSVRRWYIEDPPAGDAALARFGGHAIADLVHVDREGATIRLVVDGAGGGYSERRQLDTAVPSSTDAVVFGDADGDGYDDLWAVGPATFDVYSFASGFSELIGSGVLPSASASARFVTGDRDVDGLDELWVIESELISVVGVDGSIEMVAGPLLSAPDTVAVSDYDGDGRPDVAVLDATTNLTVYAGNTALAGTVPERWFLPQSYDCPSDTLPYHHEGRFADDDTSVFQSDIDWIAGVGITRGCNPPFEDHFCPESQITRGQMAAFLVRALDLEPGASVFADTSESEFEAEIGALAAAGITRGCDPPANTRFCPNDRVTRGQMAAFLNRALDLVAADASFSDTVGSVFASDIAALAAADITRGCDPPANTRFCPNDRVNRGQMAAFLHRALDG